MLTLKPFITPLVARPESDWAKMSLAVQAVKVISVATDKAESDAIH